MAADPRCPQCKSDNVIFSKKRRRHVCEDCGHSFDIAEAVAPLRIFLSYGHDSNEDLVRRIKSDLETRGHDVWFDRSSIRAGDDWRRAITEGILGSHRVLSFLSRHSIRDPGVCLDEIAIAVGVKGGNIQTILVEGEADVRPPPSISHIQWLDMRDWKDQRAAGEAAWEDWYGDKLAEIVSVVESEETQRFAGEIEDLNRWLMPISSESRVSRLLSKPFVGRDWLFDAVEHWRSAADRSSRLFWILGDPGVGKSAFAARLAHYGRDRVLAAQFVEWDKPDHRDPRRVVRSLAFQLATRLPEYRKLLLNLPEEDRLDRKGPEELFDYLLANPLRTVIKGGRQRYLVIVDALDEAEEGGINLLADLLARDGQRLPDWIALLVTSRPECAVKTPLQGLKPHLLDTRLESNLADIRAYLSHELASQLVGRPNAASLIEQILEKSEGVFLYVERFCDDVRRNDLSLDHPEQFPTGLGETYFQYFRRLFPRIAQFRKEARPALRTILASVGPLPLEILKEACGWSQEEVLDFVAHLGALFTVTGVSPCIPCLDQRVASPAQTNQSQMASDQPLRNAIRAFHRSLADWLTDHRKAGHYYVSLSEGHHMLATIAWEQLGQTDGQLSPYFSCNLLRHLIEIADVPMLIETLKDPRIINGSPTIFCEDFLHGMSALMPPADMLAAITPAFSCVVDRAAAKSPIEMGYAIFPHEPGVTFKDGALLHAHTDVGRGIEYWVPPGAVEPPRQVLWDFIDACESVHVHVSTLLRAAPRAVTWEWYRNFWKQGALQATLDSIARCYGGFSPHVSDGADEVSQWMDDTEVTIMLKDSSVANKAEPILRKSMEGHKSFYGTISVGGARVIANYALVLMRLDRYAEAKTYAQQALDIWRQTANQEYYLSGMAHWVLGVVAERDGDKDGAVTHLREALRLLLKGNAADYPWVKEVRANLERMVREN